MITIRLIVPDAKQRTLLCEVFQGAPDLNVIYSSQTSTRCLVTATWG